MGVATHLYLTFVAQSVPNMQVRALTAVLGQSNRSVYVYRSANIEISAGHGNRRRARLPDRSDAVVAMAFYLGGCNLGVQDSASVTQPAGLLFVSPGQINFRSSGNCCRSRSR